MFIEDMLDKVDHVNDADGKRVGAKTRSAVAGALAGCVIGLMIGYSKKWNLFQLKCHSRI